MDHLPFPHDVEPPAVLFVSTQYDHGSDTFSRYPRRKGMKDDISTCSFVRLPPDAYQSFFQTWLYFGCLANISDIIGLPIDPASFVQRTTDGVDVVTSARLNEYLDRWRDREVAHPRSKKAMRGEEQRLKKVLDIMRKMLRGPLQEFHRFLASHHSRSPVTSSWPNIVLSIAVLGYTFQRVSDEIYGYFYHPKQRVWGVQWALRERLQRRHWCKALIAKFLAEEDIDFVLFVSSTPFPRAFENHDLCNDTVCRGRIADTETYQTKHVVDGCSCKMWDMPSSAADIVDKEGIPLATWSDEGGLKVVKYKPEMPYVAISHVWSDGKGNRIRNALPQCQLESIQAKVTALYTVPRTDLRPAGLLFGPWTRHGPRDSHRQPAGFWMDTLCVPVRESQAHIRRKAIMQMRQIYEEADRVLVLDDQIQQLSVSSPFCDRAIRLIVSNWQSRIWTLQEGIMAQQLFIQFSDGVFTLDELQEEEGQQRNKPANGGRCRGASPWFWHRVTTNLQTLLSINLQFDLEKEDLHTRAPHELFGALIPVAKNRMTSWYQDETICLAALMRLDPNPLLAIQRNSTWEELQAMPKEARLEEERRVCEGRMKQFLVMTGRFNKSIIFNELPRLPGCGFRWAPWSFLGQSGASNFVDLERFHQITSSIEGRTPILFANNSASSQDPPQPDDALGLFATFPGIMLHTVSRSLIEEGTFYVREKRLKRFHYRVTLKDPPRLAELEHAANQYALVTLGAAIRDNDRPIPAVFGVFLGMMDKRVRKLRHLCIARVKVMDRRHEVAKEKGQSVPVCEDEPEEGEAWMDEDSNNWTPTKAEDSEDSSREEVEDLGYNLSDMESGRESEDSWVSGDGGEVEGNSGDDGNADAENDDSSDWSDEEDDDEEDDDEEGEDEEDGDQANKDNGYRLSNADTGEGEARKGLKREEGQDEETSESELEGDSGEDDIYEKRRLARDDATQTGTDGTIVRTPLPKQVVYGKVLVTDNNKWCIM